MPRIIRSQLTGEMHHVTARGVLRQAIFLDDFDRWKYLRLFGKHGKKVGWRCLSYCLMSNHIHLLLEAPQPALSRGMQLLHSQYAQWHNRRHDASGHLFERRFDAEPVEDDLHLWTTIAYVVNNPVAAHICATPEAWPWSSHVAVLSGDRLPWLDSDRLFDYLGAAGGDPRRIYVDLVRGQTRVRPRLG